MIPMSYAAAACALLALHGPATTAAASQAAAPQRAQRSQPFTLTVTNDGGFIDVALVADRARVADVAAALAGRLGAPITVGPTLQAETVTVNLPSATLETALASLAPRAYVDYEIRQGSRPAPQAVYLLGPGDPEPARTREDRGQSMGVMITGDTEDSGKDDEPLKVVGDKHLLTVTAKKQPLALVAIALSETLGVPLELAGNAGGNEIVDADIKDQPAEDVVPSLSPQLRLYVRTEVIQLEKTLLRLAVVPTANR